MHCGPKLDGFTTVTVNEKAKLLNTIAPTIRRSFGDIMESHQLFLIIIIITMPVKSSPSDFVPTSVHKRFLSVFLPLIARAARLANLSFDQGKFPFQFKQAQVTPLLKIAEIDGNNLASCRPIPNENTISKIIEGLALARL